MLRLDTIKQELGIPSTRTTDDAVLLRYAAEATALIRQKTGRGISWQVDHIQRVGARIRIRSIGHQLEEQDAFLLRVQGVSPTVNAEYTVAEVLDQNTIAATWGGGDLTVETVSGSLHPTRTRDIVVRDRRRVWLPQEIVPLDTVRTVSERTVSLDWETVDPAHWTLFRTSRESRVSALDRTEGQWSAWRQYPRGQYALGRPSAIETLRVAYDAGARSVPLDVQMAAISLVTDLFQRQGTGKDTSTLQYDGATQSKMSGEERVNHILSVQRVIETWNAR